MANAYGIVHQYGEPQSTFDSELAISVLQGKQGQFDANQQKIDQTLAQMGLQASMIKNEDAKKYLSDRVNQVIQETQNLRTSDIGSKDSTRKILSTINAALDDKALKHIGYGQQIEQFQSSVNSAIEGGKFSNINYQDAVNNAGLSEYLNGTADSDLGKLSYTPYIDISTELVSKIKDAKEIMGKQVVEIADENNPGRMVKTTYDNLTPAQWLQVMPNMITPQMDAQLEVEGRAMFGWDQNNLINYKEEAIENELTPYKEEVKKIEKRLKTDMSDAKREKLKGELASYRKRISSLENEALKQDYDMTSIGKGLRRNKLFRSIASIAGSDPSVEESYDKDMAEMLFIKTMGALTLPEGTNISDTTTGDLAEITEESFRNATRERESEYKGSINSGFNTLTPEQKKEANELAQTYQDEGYTISEARFKAFEKAAKKANSPEALAALDQAAENRRRYQMANKVDKEGYEDYMAKDVWVENSSKIFKAITEKGFFDDTKIVDKNGNPVHSKDYLKSRGIETEEQFIDFLETEDGQELKGQILADNLLNETNTSTFGTTSNIASSLRGNVAVRFSKEDLHNLKSLGAAYGEDLKVTDLFSITTNSDNPVEVDEGYILDHLKDGVEEFRIKLNSQAKNTKSYRALEKRLNFAPSPKGTPLLARAVSATRDQNFYEDRDLRSIFSRGNASKGVEKRKQERSVAINAPKKITIDPPPSANKRSEQWKAVMRAVSSRDSEGNFRLDEKTPVEIRPDALDPNKIIISQIDVQSKANFDKGKTQRIAEMNEVRIDRTQFNQNFKELAQLVDMEEQAGALNFTSDFEEEKEGLSYSKGNDRESVKAYTDFFGNPNLSNLASEAGSIEVLKRTLPEDMVNEYMPEFRKALANSDKFSVSLKKKGEGQYAKIFFNDEEKIEIGSLDLSSWAPRQVLSSFNVAPQIFLSQYMQIMAKDIRENEGYPTKRLEDFMMALNQL